VPDLPYLPSLTTSMPASACSRTASITDSVRHASNSPCHKARPPAPSAHAPDLDHDDLLVVAQTGGLYSVVEKACNTSF
jgi:hypothetical protein